VREAVNLRLTEIDLEMLLQCVVLGIGTLHLGRERVIDFGTGRKFYPALPYGDRVDLTPVKIYDSSSLKLSSSLLQAAHISTKSSTSRKYRPEMFDH
jgi:hypothetical protein